MSKSNKALSKTKLSTKPQPSDLTQIIDITASSHHMGILEDLEIGMCRCTYGLIY